MPAVLLHRARIAWSSEGLARDPLAELFALAEPAEPGAPCDHAIDCALRAAPIEAERDPIEEGLTPSFFHGIVQAYRGPSFFLLWDRSSRVKVSDRAEGGPVIEAQIAPPSRERITGTAAATLQIAIAIALRAARMFHLHAAALVHPNGACAILAGGSGAGKTTTTLALLDAGFGYLGDDALFVTGDDPARIVAFPRAFHLAPATLAAFPRLAALAGPAPSHSDKRPLDPRVAYPGKARASIAAERGRLFTFLPSIADRDRTSITPAQGAEAFGHVIASSASLIIDGVAHREENLRALARIFDTRTAFDLALGRDALADPTIPARAVAGVMGRPS